MRTLLTIGSVVLLFLAAVSSAQAVVVTIDFDALDTSAGPITGAALDGYLAGFGITITNQVGPPAVEVTNTANMGGFVFPASPPNFLWSPGTNNPFSYQVNFSTPLDSFVFTRLSYNALASEWDARALDINGTTITQVGEPQGVFGATTFALDPAPLINAVVFERTTVNAIAGLNNPPTDNWVLTFTQPVPEPGTLLLLGAGLAGLAARARCRRKTSKPSELL